MTAQANPGERQGILSASMQLLAGPIAWAVHLSLVYGFQSLACSVVQSPLPQRVAGYDSVQLAILAATVGVLVLLFGVILVIRSVRRSQTLQLPRFQWRVALLLALLASFGILAQGAAALMLPGCPALR